MPAAPSQRDGRQVVPEVGPGIEHPPPRRPRADEEMAPELQGLLKCYASEASCLPTAHAGGGGRGWKVGGGSRSAVGPVGCTRREVAVLHTGV